MSRSDCAVSFFRQGFSCSQAVAAAFAADYGLDKETALRLSQAFGGGIAKSADWCGAVTGAFLVIGLKYGRIIATDTSAKDKTYALTQEFIKQFKTRHGHVRCLDLLGCDIGTPAGQKTIEDQHLHQTRCEPLIKDAVEILDDIL